MLLAFDIGNTNIKVVIFDNQQPIFQWRISTDAKRTGDEYYSIIRILMRSENIDFKNINNVIISSVVPQLIGAFVITSQKITGKKPIKSAILQTFARKSARRCNLSNWNRFALQRRGSVGKISPIVYCR